MLQREGSLTDVARVRPLARVRSDVTPQVFRGPELSGAEHADHFSVDVVWKLAPDLVVVLLLAGEVLHRLLLLVNFESTFG